MQGVWASKYNERALLSMKKVGLDFNDLRMAVLVQRVVPAEYAFVLHTRNPSNGCAEEIYAEVVKGLGEAIVSGMVPGTSMSFVTRKSDLDNPQVFPPLPHPSPKPIIPLIPLSCNYCKSLSLRTVLKSVYSKMGCFMTSFM